MGKTMDKQLLLLAASYLLALLYKIKGRRDYQAFRRKERKVRIEGDSCRDYTYRFNEFQNPHKSLISCGFSFLVPSMCTKE